MNANLYWVARPLGAGRTLLQNQVHFHFNFNNVVQDVVR